MYTGKSSVINSKNHKSDIRPILNSALDSVNLALGDVEFLLLEPKQTSFDANISRFHSAWNYYMDIQGHEPKMRYLSASSLILLYERMLEAEAWSGKTFITQEQHNQANAKIIDLNELLRGQSSVKRPLSCCNGLVSLSLNFKDRDAEAEKHFTSYS